MEFNKVCPKLVSIWVKFLDVPMELWSPLGLSYMASMVGRLLVLDRITEETCHDKLICIGFARILIEANTSRKLPDMIRIMMPIKKVCERKPMEVKVDY